MILTAAALIASLLSAGAPAEPEGLRGRIAFVDEIPRASGAPADMEIYVLDPATGEVERRTHNRVGDFDVAWSRSGSELAFARYTGRGVSARLPNADVFVMSSPGAAERLTDTLRIEAEPAISPDGARIAFTRWGYDAYPPRAEIWVMDRGGSNARRLTDSRPFGAGNPAWSPDGSRIAFVSDRSGDPDLYVMDADGGNVQLVAGSAAHEGDPEWSPDGATIAYERSPGDAARGGILLLDVATGRKTRLTSRSVTASDPTWSPDGSMIAFLGNREGNPPWDLYVTEARPDAPWELLLESAGPPTWAP